MSFIHPEPAQPRMRAAAWSVLAAFAVALMLHALHVIDLRRSGFAVLMAICAVSFVTQAWARKGDTEAQDG